MTKVLIITNTTDFTVDYVVRSLDNIQASYYRLNTDEIGTYVFLSFNFAEDKYILYDKLRGITLDILSFTSVYFRRPNLPSINDNGLSSDEKQFIILEERQTLEGLYKILRNAYWISDVDSIRRAENKIYQQLLAKEIGFQIASGIVTNHQGEFMRFWEANNDCIIKPIYSGQIGWPEMKKVVYTSKLDNIPTPAQIEVCPNYVQQRLKKKFDIRVTVVDETIFAVRIHSQLNPETHTDWRVGENILKHEVIELPVAVKSQCVALLKKLNLKFGAIDFVETEDNEYVFLEINPNGQWAWIQTQTGMPISDKIAKLLTDEHTS